MSPLVALVGFSTTVPVRTTSLPSVASSGPRGPSGDRSRQGAGTQPARDRIGGRADLELAVRIGELAADLEEGPASGRADAVGQLHHDPAARVRDREQGGRSKPARLGGHDSADRHGRADGPGPGVGDGDGRGAGRRSRGSAASVRTSDSAKGSVSARARRSAWGSGTASESARGLDHEVGRRGDVQAVAGRAGPAAVALAERARDRDERSVRQRSLAERIRRHDDPDRARAVIDGHGKSVREDVRTTDDGPSHRHASAFERLASGHCRDRDRFGDGALADDR